MRNVRLQLLILVLAVSHVAKSQDSTHSNVSQIPARYFEAVSRKANTIQENLDKKSEKVLERMQKEEVKLQKKLSKIDSLAANNIFKDAESKYKELQSKLEGTKSLSRYIPHLDTLATSFKFLEQNKEWLKNIKEGKEKLEDASSKLKELQSKLQKADDIKQFLKERREYLKQQFEKFGFVKQLKKINKEVYYYSQQVNEYREILKDPKKAERKAIELLSKTKVFKDFMKKNSMLASLFRMPGDNPNDPAFLASLAGLQTRAQVNSLIQGQVASGGSNAQQTIQQNIQQGQTQLQQLKDKVNKLGGGKSDEMIPEGFKPNDQKTKTFLQRLELGTNFQSTRGNGLLPTTSDLGLSLGYKINDKSVIGLGGSYKLGWGNGWEDISISSQGASIRGFLDWKIKGGLYISGGFEMNYLSSLNGVNIATRAGLFSANQWQQSGLVGLSKMISVKSKFFKKTKVQLFWDYLSYKQVPKAQPILFRIGYNF